MMRDLFENLMMIGIYRMREKFEYRQLRNFLTEFSRKVIYNKYTDLRLNFRNLVLARGKHRDENKQSSGIFVLIDLNEGCKTV